MAKSPDKSKYVGLKRPIPFEHLSAETRREFEFLAPFAQPSGDYYSLLESAINCHFILHKNTYRKNISGSNKEKHELLQDLQESSILSPSLNEGDSDALEEITAKAKALILNFINTVDISASSIFTKGKKLEIWNEQEVISRFQYMDNGCLAMRLSMVKLSGEVFSAKWSLIGGRTFSYTVSFQSDLFLISEKRIEMPVLDFNI